MTSLVDRLRSAAIDLEDHGTGLSRYRYSVIVATVREAAEALTPRPEGSAWQPIATAEAQKKDGRPIWVVARRVESDSPTTMFAYWNQRLSWWYRFGAREQERVYPALWAPLPSPPAEPTKTGEP